MRPFVGPTTSAKQRRRAPTNSHGRRDRRGGGGPRNSVSFPLSSQRRVETRERERGNERREGTGGGGIQRFLFLLIVWLTKVGGRVRVTFAGFLRAAKCLIRNTTSVNSNFWIVPESNLNDEIVISKTFDSPGLQQKEPRSIFNSNNLLRPTFLHHGLALIYALFYFLWLPKMRFVLGCFFSREQKEQWARCRRPKWWRNNWPSASSILGTYQPRYGSSSSRRKTPCVLCKPPANLHYIVELRSFKPPTDELLFQPSIDRP